MVSAPLYWQIQPDELLHGYLLRRSLLNGSKEGIKGALKSLARGFSGSHGSAAWQNVIQHLDYARTAMLPLNRAELSSLVVENTVAPTFAPTQQAGFLNGLIDLSLIHI